MATLKHIVLLYLVLSTFLVDAQTPSLVKDINAGNVSSNSSLYGIQLNGGFVFSAETASQGRELWFTDASTAGTYLVKDIYPGATSSNPTDLRVIGGVIYFLADNGVNGDEIWRTDGTTNGTYMVKDISPGSASAFFQNCCGSFSFSIVWEHNGEFFFLANHQSVSGIDDVELWKSDGTTAGTVRVKDIYPGNSASYPSYFVPFNNSLFFIADNGTNGDELWKTDGTTAGTQLVKDIKPGIESGFLQNCCGGFGLYNVWEKNGSFFFNACSASNSSGDDLELWKTDGTTAGTVRLADINPGILSSGSSYFVPFGNELCFVATNNTNGRELWKTDGTTSGTQLVKDIKPGIESGFSQNCCGSFGLYNVWEKNGSFFFNACSASSASGDDLELWKSDGTTAGTVRVKDINPGNLPSNPSYFIPFGNELCFIADNGSNGRELWKTDGSSGGTQLVKDIKPGIESGFSQNCCGSFGLYKSWEKSGSLYFVACSFSGAGGDDVELWKTDGTTGGTSRVADINPGAAPSYPQEFVEFNNQLFFTAELPSIGRELYKTDGTTAGTVLVKDIYPGTPEGLPYYLTNIIWYGNVFYFTAYQLGATDLELWKTDGTTNGTVKVLDINPGVAGSYPGSFILLQNDNLIFLATDNNNATELWKLYLPGVNGVEEFSDIGKIAAFPNPCFNDGINIIIPSEEKSMLHLMDLTGKVIVEKSLPEGIKFEQLFISFPEVDPGMYFLHVKDSKNRSWHEKVEVLE